MALTSQGDGVSKGHRRGATLSPDATAKSKLASNGTESKSRSKSTVIPWRRKYHYSGHTIFQPLPPYYAGPPHPSYYHPYYYHYPIIARSHHPHQLPTASVPNDRSVSSNPKVKETRKTDVNTRPPKQKRFQNSMRKQNGGSNKIEATTISKEDNTDAVDTKSCNSSDFILTPPILQPPESNVKPNLRSTKNPSSPTKFSSSLLIPPATSSTKEKEIINKEKCTIASISKKNELQTDIPSDIVSDSCALKDSCREEDSKWTRMEVEQLADALDSDMKMESCDCSIKGKDEYPHSNEVADPVDLELMSSAKFVTFKHVGAGLDSSGNLLRKEKTDKNVDSTRSEPKKCGTQDECPAIHLKLDSDTNPNTPFPSKGSSAQKRMNRVHSTTSSKLTRSEDGKGGHSPSNPVRNKEQGVIANHEWIESRFVASTTSEKLSDCKLGSAYDNTMTKVEVLDRSKDDIGGLGDEYGFNAERGGGNIINRGNTKDLVYDTNPPFPMDDMMDNIRFHSGGRAGKKSALASKDDSAVGTSDVGGSIFRIPASFFLESHEEKEVITKSCDMDDVITKPVDEVDNTDDDVCLDSLIRSLISEDEEDSLIRPSAPPPREFSSTLLLPVVEFLEHPISF